MMNLTNFIDLCCYEFLTMDVDLIYMTIASVEVDVRINYCSFSVDLLSHAFSNVY